MSTRAPSSIAEFSAATIEKIGYASVAEIPVQEPNDRIRLGYHVWLYLSGKLPTLLEAVRNARSRILVTEDEALSIISKKLQEAGIDKTS